MGKELKTRFVASVDGKDRELFSARQSAQGDLTILLRGEHRHGFSVGDIEGPVCEQRFSVHRSDENPHGRTITFTSTTIAGVKHTQASFIKDSKANLLTRVYAELCPNLRLDRYDVQARPSDRIVRIAEDIPITSTFIYHVYVSTLDRTPPDLINCRKFVLDFSLFRLSVYGVYSRTVTTNISMYASGATAPRRIDGEVYAGDEALVSGDGVESVADEQVFQEVHSTNEVLAAAQIMDAGAREFAEHPWLHAIFSNRPLLFSLRPAELF